MHDGARRGETDRRELSADELMDRATSAGRGAVDPLAGIDLEHAADGVLDHLVLIGRLDRERAASIKARRSPNEVTSDVL